MHSTWQNVINRRDDQVARIRRLSLRVAGSTAVASLGLAAVLGAAVPGHSATHAPVKVPAAGHAHQGQPHRAKRSVQRGAKHGAKHGSHHRAGLAPPSKPPAHSSSAPVTSSGGS